MKYKTELFVPITKVEDQPDGTVVVYGKATGPDLDGDLQIADPAWLAKAMPEWFTSGANVREMHQPVAAGVGQTLEQQGDDWYLKALIVDDGSVKKVRNKVLTGYSIGIAAPKVVKDAAAPGGRIVGGRIVETSLADRPCNSTCKLALAKAEGDVVDGDVMVEADEEAQEALTVEEIQRAVAGLLAAEAQELAAGDEATGAIRALLWVLEDLDWYQEIDAYEDAVSKAAATTKKGSIVNLTELATSVKTATADDATDEQRAAIDDVRKALLPELDPAEFSELIEGKSVLAELLKIDDVDKVDDDETKNAIAGLRKVLGVDTIADAVTKAADSEELSKFEERLAEVEKQAIPGGPDRTKPAPGATGTRETELLAKAADARKLADTVNSPATADSYRRLAERYEREAAGTPTSQGAPQS